MSVDYNYDYDYDYYYYQQFPSKGYMFYIDHSYITAAPQDLCQCVISIVTILLNSYLLMVILQKKELRSLKLYPIALQALFEIVSSGIFLFLSSLDSLCYHVTFTKHHYYYFYIQYLFNGPLARFYRSLYFHWHPYYRCTIAFFVLIVNDYGTWPCILFMAIERYVTICHLGWYSRIFSKTLTRVYAVVLTLVALVPMGVAFVFTYVIRGENYRCDQSFYEETGLRYSIDAVWCFFVPLTLCTIIYLRIMWTLLRNGNNTKKRNYVLTLAFGSIFVFWALTWSLRFSMVLYRKYAAKGDDFFWILTRSLAFYLLYTWALFFKHLFSAINPVIAIIIIKPMQKPIVAFAKKCFGNGDKDDKNDLENIAVPRKDIDVSNVEENDKSGAEQNDDGEALTQNAGQNREKEKRSKKAESNDEVESEEEIED